MASPSGSATSRTSQTVVTEPTTHTQQLITGSNGGFKPTETEESMQDKPSSDCCLVWCWRQVCAFFSAIGNCICSLFSKTPQTPIPSPTETTPLPSTSTASSSQSTTTTPEPTLPSKPTEPTAASTPTPTPQVTKNLTPEEQISPASISLSAPTVDLSPLTEEELQKERTRLDQEQRIVNKQTLPKIRGHLAEIHPPETIIFHDENRSTIDPKKEIYCYYRFKLSALRLSFVNACDKVKQMTTQNTRKEFQDGIKEIQLLQQNIDSFLPVSIKKELSAVEKDYVWNFAKDSPCIF